MRALTLPWSRAFSLVCEVALSYVSGTYRRGSQLGSGDHRAAWLAGFASGFVLRVWWRAQRWASQVQRFLSWLARGALVFSHQIWSEALFPSLQCQPVLQHDGISPRSVSHERFHFKWRSIEGIIASNIRTCSSCRFVADSSQMSWTTLIQGL